MDKKLEGAKVRSKRPIEVTIKKHVVGEIYKTGKDLLGNDVVYFVTEEGEHKCFKVEDVDIIHYEAKEVIHEMDYSHMIFGFSNEDTR